MRHKLVLGSVLILCCLLTYGCVEKRIPQAASGSRAHGTVELTFDYSPALPTEVDWKEAERRAAHRCQNWGYSQAERFDIINRECIQPHSEEGCMRYRVDVLYQCVE